MSKFLIAVAVLLFVQALNFTTPLGDHRWMNYLGFACAILLAVLLLGKVWIWWGDRDRASRLKRAQLPPDDLVK